MNHNLIALPTIVSGSFHFTLSLPLIITAHPVQYSTGNLLKRNRDVLRCFPVQYSTGYLLNTLGYPLGYRVQYSTGYLLNTLGYPLGYPVQYSTGYLLNTLGYPLGYPVPKKCTPSKATFHASLDSFCCVV
eukprot:7391619-Prymnesium_polylepis.4